MAASLPLRSLRAPSARILWSVLMGGLLLYIAARTVLYLLDWPHVWALLTGADHAIYLEQARRVLAGGPLYPAYELAGPFVPTHLPELYPPLTVYGLIVPLSLLPGPVWWLVPIGVTAWIVVRHRPNRWAWLGIVACLAIPSTPTVLLAGNPSLWAMMLLALGTLRPAFAIGVLLKPTLGPFALFGIRSRWWWVGLALVAAFSLVTLPLTLEYITVLRNYRAVPSLIDVPLMLIPVIAYYGSVTRNQLTEIAGVAAPKAPLP